MAASVGLVLDPWQQFALEVGLSETADDRWSAFEVAIVVARQNGKGSLFEALALAKLFLFGDELIIYSAHEFKTAKEAFRRLSLLLDHPAVSPRVARMVKNPSEFGFDLRTGQRIRFFARTSGSGRGWTADTLILDEAYRLGGDGMAALLPTLSTRPNPQVWYGSSAAMATSEQLHAVRRRALAGGSDRLAYLEWSAPENADPTDPAAQLQANPAVGYRMGLDFIRAELDALTLPEFRRERLSIPDDPAGFTIDGLSVEDWNKLTDPTAEPTGDLVFAADVAPGHAAASIVAVGGDVIELVEHRRGSGWLAERLVELVGRHGGRVAYDPAGPIGALAPALQATGLSLVPIDGTDAVRACGSLIQAVAEGSFRHRGEAEFTAAIAGARRRPVGDGHKWSRRDSTVDISPLVAATVGLWVAATVDDEITPGVWFV